MPAAVRLSLVFIASGMLAIGLIVVGARFGGSGLLLGCGAVLLTGLGGLQWAAWRRLRAAPDAERADALLQSFWATRWLFDLQRAHARNAGQSERADDLPEDD